MKPSVFEADRNSSPEATEDESLVGGARERSLKRSWRKKAIFALIPVSVLLLSMEAGLWLVGYESPVADPYESFVLRRPLFESQDGVLTTALPRQRFFHLQQFTRFKPENTKRVFVFGGSTTYGFTPPPKKFDPRCDAYVFQLGRLLEEEFPGTQFEMINCGGLSYASYRLVDLVEECMEYSPDLVIVMSGHNEFIEARHYADLIGSTSAISRVWYSLRTVRLVQHLSSRFDAHKPFMPEDPFTTEQYIVRDAKEFQYTLDHYGMNLNRMVDTCRDHNTPIILCTCPSNLLNHPPFHTVCPKSMSQAEFENRIRHAKAFYQAGQTEKSLAIAKQVLQDDPRSAEFHFIAGNCYYRMKRMEEAKRSLMLALETDAFPKRALNSFNKCVRDIARQRDTALFDAEAQYCAASDYGIPGANLFVDDCHPTADGHRLFAEGLRAICAEIFRDSEKDRVSK